MKIDNIKWLSHASFKISGPPLIYIDPWKLRDREPAQVILITHSHYDHFSLEDINRIRTEDTTIIAPKDCQAPGNLKHISPGETLKLKNIEIEAVPAYNLGKSFHPQSNQWVGYVITIEGVKIYHAGDTDFIPEMETLKVDIALLPIGGTYTMNAEEAAQCANTIKPKIVVPMHYGDIVGSSRDVERFKELSSVQVEILRR